MYIFNNLTKQNSSPVHILDFTLRRSFAISFTTKPVMSANRINYSLSNFNNKIYIYGGIDDKNKLISTMETLDVTTYKF